MNAYAEYRRLPRPTRPDPAPEPQHVPFDETVPASQRGVRVAWVRPTELASYAGPMIGRGVDLQAELVRRARRTPTTAGRTLRHHTPIPTTTPTAPRTEGLGL